MKQKLPDICDLCGLDISGNQYTFEVYEGKQYFKDQTKGKNMDCCHKCFMGICQHGYKPEWVSKIMNPLYVKGGKEPYRIPKPEVLTPDQSKLASVQT